MKLSEIEKAEFGRYMEKYNFNEAFEGKTFLVTGCKGIVGSGVIKWLLQLNQLNDLKIGIIASTRNPQDVPDYIENGDTIEFCEFGKEKLFCSGKRIDYIIHAASPTGNTFHKAHPVESLRVIVDSTEQMLEIAADNPGCKMLYISSEEVYGLPKSEKPICEDYVGAINSLNIRSCYPLGKKVCELLCFNYFTEYGIDVKIIRPTVIHGLLQKYNEQRVVNEILRCIVENRNLVMKSAGLTKKCLMYSLDAIAAMFTVLTKGKAGEAYNTSNPDIFITVRDLASGLFEKFNPSIKVEFAEQDTAVSEGYLPQRSLLQDISKIKALGWEPITSLEKIYEVDIERFTKQV